MRLRTRLLLLILSSMLPLIGYSAAAQFIRFRDAQRDFALDRAGRMADAVRQAVDARLVALRVLALAPELQAGDFAGFRRPAEALIAGELPGANVLVLREDGQQMMNTAVPAGAPLPTRASSENSRRVFRTGTPLLSDVFFGVVLRRFVVAIEVPVRASDGRIIYDLALNPTPNAFLDPLRGERSFGAVTTVYDRKGVVVARSRDHERFVGHVAPAPLLAHLLPSGPLAEPMVELASPEGASVVALQRVDPYGWTVAVSLPANALSAAALRSALPTLAVGGMMVLLSLALSLLAAKQISRPIAALRNMAGAPGENDWRDVSRLPEVHGVALVLEEARFRVRARTADLENTIRQRDLLLREVYHRVKNNLQMVDSLLALQGRTIADPKASQEIEELRDRIHTLAIVHAQLMLSPDLKSFDVGPFLRELTDNLAGSLTTGERAVTVMLECDPLPVTLDFAIPLGLLVNELITNSAKHARPHGPGTILVRFRQDLAGRATLTVQDRGTDPAAPARFETGNGTGGRLVRGLVKQLDGEMSVGFEAGMRIDIRLPLPEDLA